MNSKFNKGVYPVMLTPFTEDNNVDYEALGKLVDWYLDNGVAGLFAVCQSSEMFFLTLEERVEIARYIVKRVNGRVPVIASGHISESEGDQIEELNKMAETGIDALIFITNRMAKEVEGDEIWMERTKKLMDNLPIDLPLGLYECPYPYKRVLSKEVTKWCADSGRFYFLKDTCCDINLIKEKLEVINDTNLQLFNANSSTLLESLKEGAAGYSGVMANFHSDLYVWLCANYDKESEKSKILMDFLTTASMIERQVYPVNAKYYQKSIGNFNSLYTRTKSASELNKTAKSEIDQLTDITEYIRGKLI